MKGTLPAAIPFAIIGTIMVNMDQNGGHPLEKREQFDGGAALFVLRS